MRISDWSSDVCSSDLAVIAGGVGPEEKAACKSRTRTMRVRAGAVGKASREVAVPAIDISNHSGETNRDSFQQASARSLRLDTAGVRARGGFGACSDHRRPDDRKSSVEGKGGTGRGR